MRDPRLVPDTPDAPLDVRLVLAGGQEVPCRVEYEGDDVDGVHCWVAVAPVEPPPLPPGSAPGAPRSILRIGRFPARTSIRFEVRPVGGLPDVDGGGP